MKGKGQSLFNRSLLLVLIFLAGQISCNSGAITPSQAPGAMPIQESLPTPSLTPSVEPTFASQRLELPTLEIAAASSEQVSQAAPAPSETLTPSPTVSLPLAETPAANCLPVSGYHWAFTYGDDNFNAVDGIHPTQDGGLIFVGNGGSFIPGYYAVWAAKMNPDGSLAWKKAYRGTTGATTSVLPPVIPGRIVVANGGKAFAISEQDGAVIWQMGTADAGPAIDTPDGGFALVREKGVIKFTPQAKKAWQVYFDAPYWTASTPKGEFIFARIYLYADPGSVYRPIYTDIEVIKVSVEGKIAWHKSYGKSLGDDETLDAILPTQDGGVLLAGTHWGIGEAGETDIWVLKLSGGGSKSWQATLSGKYWDQVYRLSQAPNGEYFIAGYTEMEIGEPEVLVAKFKTNGTLAWQKKFSNYGSIDEIVGLADGGVLVSLADDTLLARLDRNGKLLWDKTYEPGQYFTVLKQTGADLLLGGRSVGRALMLNLQDAGSASGVIQVKDSDLRVSTSFGSRAPLKLEISQTDMAVRAPGISAVEVATQPISLCLAEGGQQIVPTRTPTATPVFTPSPTPPPFTRTLYLTTPPMTGDDVLALQTRLRVLGYTEVGAPDGVFGQMTDEAVRHFQKRNGLEVDGVVGPKTWEKLFSSSAVRA